MRVLLVNPVMKRYYKSPTCPLGLLSIATYLHQQGHIIKIIDAAVKNVNYQKEISAFQPDIVGVSVISNKSIADAVRVSKTARSQKIPVVWGGTLASAIPEIILRSGFVDYVVIGEGEITFDMLLEALKDRSSLANIDGLAFLRQGTVVINPDRAFADLADFHVLDWTFVNPADYFQQMFSARKMLYLYSAKGCPARCTFCFNKGFNRCVYRARPFEHCLEEIAFLTSCCAMDGVHFADELWCENKTQLAEKCEKLLSRFPALVWGCNARIGSLAQPDFELMYRAGCRWIFFGVESGSPDIQKLIKKGIELHKVETTVRGCYEAGIVPVVSLILGFPDETPAQVRQTADLARKLPEALFDVNFFFPLPATELCDMLIQRGSYHLPATLREFSRLLPTEKLHDNFSKTPARDLKVVRSYFMWSTFLRKGLLPGQGRPLAVKAVKDAFKGICRHGLGNAALSAAYDAATFLGIMAARTLHPRIRQQYGLFKRTQS